MRRERKISFVLTTASAESKRHQHCQQTMQIGGWLGALSVVRYSWWALEKTMSQY